MDNFRIPRKNYDLQEYVNAKHRTFAIKYGIFSAAILLMEVGFLFDAVNSRLGIVNAIAQVFILFIAPIFIFGGHTLLLDKAWEGKVLLIDYSSHNVYTHKSKIRPLGSKLRTTFSVSARHSSPITHCETCEIYIETDSGKTITYKSYLAPEDKTLPIEVGTRLRKYKGLPYPVILGNGKSECAICGRVNDEEVKECIACRHSIIKTN